MPDISAGLDDYSGVFLSTKNKVEMKALGITWCSHDVLLFLAAPRDAQPLATMDRGI